MILDSGERREFGTGAVRDVQSGKGRCDLMPLHEVAEIIFDKGTESDILEKIYIGYKTHDTMSFILAAQSFCEWYMDGTPNAMLEVAIHFEEGAKKYGAYNWQKGIPCHCYIDSGVRHFLKVLRGDTDENHRRAFVWNMLCLVWTIRNRPECNDLWDGNTIGNVISESIEDKGITLTEFAEECGITEVTLARIVRGEKIPNKEESIKISKALEDGYADGTREKGE